MEPILSVALSVAEVTAHKGSSLAIFVFNGLKQLLFMNTEAGELTQRLAQACNEKNIRTGIPQPVVDLCEDLAKLLHERSTPKDWEQVLLRRVVGGAKLTVLLRGYGFPYTSDLQEGCFLILMEEIQDPKIFVRPSTTAATRLQELYNITDREQMVLVHLLEGMTNKEIATKLSVSDNAVKDHLKRLMHKTHTCTRTGLLARIILTASECLRQEK